MVQADTQVRLDYLNAERAKKAAAWRRLTPMQQCLESRTCRKAALCSSEGGCYLIGRWTALVAAELRLMEDEWMLDTAA